MELDKLVKGSVYADTNILYMYLRSDPLHLPAIKSFLKRAVKGDLEIYIGIPVLDELFYRLLLAKIKDESGANPINTLRNNPAGSVARLGGSIEAVIRKLLLLPHLNLTGIEPEDADNFLKNIATFSLLPHDALHLSIIQRLNISDIASDDRDFDRIKWLNRHWVINPPEK